MIIKCGRSSYRRNLDFAVHSSRKSKGGTLLINLVHCREAFHAAFNKTKSQKFFFTSERINSTVKFIKIIEKKVGVQEGITYSKTNEDDVFIIDPGWWLHQKMTMSLLTILLRCGDNYDTSFKDALFSKSYTQITKEAINRFLAGYTWYTGKMSMWVSQFSRCCTAHPYNPFLNQQLDIEKINQLLVKPAKIKKTNQETLKKAEIILDNLTPFQNSKKLLALKLAEELDKLTLSTQEKS